MRYLLCTPLLIALSLASQAQDSARVVLPVTEITALRVQLFSAGLHSTALDSQALRAAGSASLADVLQQQLPVYFKNYSPGSLATPGLRGTAAAHTGVVWNGLVLNSAQNSTLDLSLLPAVAFDAAAVQWGGAGAHYGSGLVGGSLLLSTAAKETQQITAGLGWGSLGLWQAQLRADVPLGPISTSTRLFTQQSRNDFLYANAAQLGAPTQRLQHAAQKGMGVVHSTSYALPKGRELAAHIWWQENERQLPSNMTDLLPGRALQRDQSLRSMLHYQAGQGAQRWVLRVASVLDMLQYTPNAQHDMRNDSRQWGLVAEAEWRYQRGAHWLWNLGLHQARYQGWADGYPQGVVQQRWAGFAAARYSSARLVADISLRQENTDARWLPLIPLAGLRWQLHPLLALRAAASLSYRVPTLNERYWQPGGNPNLLPEQGYSYEGGLQFKHSWGRHEVAAQPGVYYSRVRNWVQWLPNAQGDYSPRNIQSVQSWGLEQSASWQVRGAKTLCQIGVQYHLTQSRILATENAEEVGKPLIYTPLHNFNAHVLLRYHSLLLRYNHPLVGARFADNSGTAPLPAYDLGHVQVSYAYGIQKHKLTWQAGINNLYDQRYQNQRWFAMPGRQYTISLSYTNQ